ncbi:MAG: FGGY family carbohydrate kinase [Thermoanaerobaculia bacterium]
MSESLFAVIDQGSTATKGALLTYRGERRFETSLPVERRAEGPSVVHDPEALAAGVESVLEQLLAAGRVTAIGLACQRSTCLLWERESGKALTAALSWQDRSEAERVEGLVHRAEEVSRRTGLRLSPHYAAPKLARLLRRLPSGVSRAEAGELVAGTLDAFLVRRLTGRDATDPGHAGRTLLYNLDSGDWDPTLCELFGVPAAALPELRPSAGSWGAFRGVPLTAVAGDQQAALLGHGGWQEGVTAVHFGTGAFVLAATGSRLLRHPSLLSAVLATTGAGRRFQIEGPVNSAGSAVDWACRLTGQDLAAWQALPLDVERLPWVLPAFAGIGAPWWRARASAAVIGLGLEVGPRELVAAVLAGVAQRVLDCVESLQEAGVATRVLRVSGRLTRLEGMVGLLADAGQLTVEVSAEEETGLAGIARLAEAGQTGDEGPLGEPPTACRRREPAWSASRARGARDEWRRFVQRTLELTDPTNGQGSQRRPI